MYVLCYGEEKLDRKGVHILCLPTDRACDVRPMTLIIYMRGTLHSIVAQRGAALEFFVRSQQPGVDDVGECSFAGCGVVDVIRVVGHPVRNVTQSLRGVRLGDVFRGPKYGVRLDELYILVTADLGEGIPIHGTRVGIPRANVPSPLYFDHWRAVENL